MAGDGKKTKTTPAPKTEAPKTEAPKTEAPKTEAPKTEAPKTETVAGKKDPSPAMEKTVVAAEPAKVEGSETAAAAPKSYSRGEGQKPVSQAYKDNWTAIFGKKSKKKKKR
jgi:hypothetical protein